MKNSKKKAFSLAEIIISMTLIILVTGSGIMASNITIAARKKREQNINIWSMSNCIYNSALDSVFLCKNNSKNKTIDERFIIFISEFNSGISYAFAVNDFSNIFIEQNIMGKEKKSWFLSSNNIETRKDNSLTGFPLLVIEHNNSVAQNNPYTYLYTYNQNKYSIVLNIMLDGDKLNLTIEGYCYTSKNSVYKRVEAFVL